MMRTITAAIFLMALTGCNLQDNIVFPGSGTDTGNNENNNSPDMTAEPDMSVEEDTGGPNGFMAELTNVTVNGAALPTDVPARGAPFSLAGEFTATNSADCPGCNVQLIVGLADGSAYYCIYDDVPTDEPAMVMADLQAASETGAQDLLWEAVEHQDCEDALAVIEARPDPPARVAGSIVFTDPPPLAVTSVTPGDAEIGVAVNTTIRIAFDEVLDAASAQGRVTLSNADGNVPAPMTVTGNEIILTPSNDLTELQTEYTVRVSAGVNGNGRSLDEDFTSTFTTRMFVANVWYAAHNEFQGINWQLGVDSAAQCQMQSQDDTALTQRFRFVPQGTGWVAYNGQFPGRGLEGGDGVMNCSMTPLGPDPGQIWTFISQPNGTFQFQTQRLGNAQSLDNGPNMGDLARPVMQPTTAINRQYWRWRRLN